MPVYAADVDEALAGVIYGAVLIAFMYALPGGVMGALRKLRGKFNDVRRRQCEADGCWCRCWRR